MEKILETDYSVVLCIVKDDSNKIVSSFSNPVVAMFGPPSPKDIFKNMSITWATLEEAIRDVGYDIFRVKDTVGYKSFIDLRALATLAELYIAGSCRDVEDAKGGSVTKLFQIAQNATNVLIRKGRSYGQSWQRRGGIGAFMMAARKWDRIENQMSRFNDVISEKGSFLVDNLPSCVKMYDEELLDDIQDLRNYLLLISAYIHQAETATDGEATKAYTNQG